MIKKNAEGLSRCTGISFAVCWSSLFYWQILISFIVKKNINCESMRGLGGGLNPGAKGFRFEVNSVSRLDV